MHSIGLQFKGGPPQPYEAQMMDIKMQNSGLTLLSFGLALVCSFLPMLLFVSLEWECLTVPLYAGIVCVFFFKFYRGLQLRECLKSQKRTWGFQWDNWRTTKNFTLDLSQKAKRSTKNFKDGLNTFCITR